MDELKKMIHHGFLAALQIHGIDELARITSLPKIELSAMKNEDYQPFVRKARVLAKGRVRLKISATLFVDGVLVDQLTEK